MSFSLRDGGSLGSLWFQPIAQKGGHSLRFVTHFHLPASLHRVSNRWLVRVLILLILIGISTFPAQGQTPLPPLSLPPITEPSGRSGEPPELLEKTEPPMTSPRGFTLPPIETLPEFQRQRFQGLRVFAKKILLQGNTVFSEEKIRNIVDPYEQRDITTEDLEQLRRTLTLLYVENGYINSGAIIPDQDIKDGIITIQIIEGKLTDIQIAGTTYFLPWYFSDRISLGAGPPLNVRPLKERLHLLLQDSRIERLNSELQPGLNPGESILHVQVQEASPFQAWAEFNNFQSPTVGAERGLGTIATSNPFGIGDYFQFTFGRSEGVNPLLDTSYIMPLSARGTTLALQYRHNDFTVVSSPFDTLDIESHSRIFTIALRHPIYRTLTDEVALELIGEHHRNKNFIGGTGFSFTPGTTSDGEAIVSALRVAQEWIHRESLQVLAFRSQFSVGLDILNATNTRRAKHDPDAQFFAWLGQGQWARRIAPWNIQFLTSMALQVANDSLFPLEQFAVGGRFSVRGYRENQLVRDNAFLFSAESRIPILPDWLGNHFRVFIAPFVDVGHSWNAKNPTPDPKTLASIGVGVRLTVWDRAFANVYWGQQLNHVSDPTSGGNLQDHGLHVQFVLNVL